MTDTNLTSYGVHIDRHIGIHAIDGEAARKATLLEIGMPPSYTADEYIALRICDESNDVLVDVMASGTLRYGPHYDPDEAARVFWSSMASSLPQWFTFIKGVTS